MRYSFGIIVPKGFEDDFKRVEVVRVTTKGNKAVARLRIPKELLKLPTIRFIARKNRLGLRREGGEWRVELLSLL
jgi:hypothetical protein